MCIIALNNESSDIIQIQQKTETKYIGFSLVDEQLKVYKKSDCIILKEETIQLLSFSKPTKTKLLLALSQTNEVNKAAEFMGMSNRNFIRLSNELIK